MFIGINAEPARLDSYHSDGVIKKGMEQAHGIGAATDTGYEGVGQSALGT